MRLTRLIACLTLAAVFTYGTVWAEGGGTVRRLCADFSTFPFEKSPWNIASGSFKMVAETPEGAGSEAKESMSFTADFAGKGFAHFTACPINGKIPGDAKCVRFWAKCDADGAAWVVKFKNAQGKDEVEKKKLEYGIKSTKGKWVKQEFQIPADWERPVSLSGFLAHNWSKQSDTFSSTLLVYGLEVETDTSKAADKSALFACEARTGVENNVFAEGESPTFSVSLDSWLGTKLEGTMKWTMAPVDGNLPPVAESRPVSIDGVAMERIVLKPPRFGAYSLELSVSFGDKAPPFAKKCRFSYIPAPRPLTAEEKLISPYGLNIHGGQEGVGYKAIAKTGFAWIRDYAYSHGWMIRAKGADCKYGGWPWYPKMDKEIRESGLMILPCMMQWIGDGVKAGKMNLDKSDKIEMLDIIKAFPDYPAWEVDNEYDLHNGKEEEARQWSSYRAYHKTFSEVVKFMDDKTLTVEQGNAGVYPERVREHVMSGAFDKIDVVNAHFYCGTQPPELCKMNFNTGGGATSSRYVYDTLREFVEAGCADGKKRQAWVTEFGWDTMVGHIVSEHEQAAFLQRGYLLGLQAGIDKMFWYWNRDTKKKPTHFFDGCGLLDPNDEPKPAQVSMAGLAHFLRLPARVGTFQIGPGTMGHVFKDDGRLVACAFTLEPGKPATVFEPAAGLALFDMYGNPLPKGKVEVGIAPVWMMGLDEKSALYIQTAYDLASRYFIKAVAGDTVEIKLRVVNNRSTPLSATFEVKSPADWKVDPATGALAAAPGETKIVTIKTAIDALTKLTDGAVVVTVTDGPATKTLTTEIEVVQPASVVVAPLTGAPGAAKTKAVVRNNSTLPKSFTLKIDTPASWKATPAEAKLDDIPPASTREVELAIDWNIGWKSGEKAVASVLLPDGRKIAEGKIIPSALGLAKVDAIKLDGKVANWPEGSRLPDWCVGTANGEPVARMWAAWSAKGLYFRFEVEGSRESEGDPTWFWEHNTAEVFVETYEGNPAGGTGNMHQFWFCPLLKDGKVYAGRWKMSKEIAETQYDIKGVESFSAKTDKGYMMEFMLPASLIKGFDPEKHPLIGLNLNVTVPMANSRAEAFWPGSKIDGSNYKPNQWGRVELK